MRHHLPTLACFATAILLYVLGVGEHAALLVTGGFLAELLEWKRLVMRGERPKPRLKPRLGRN